jgi:hypothetical protein
LGEQVGTKKEKNLGTKRKMGEMRKMGKTQRKEKIVKKKPRTGQNMGQKKKKEKKVESWTASSYVSFCLSTQTRKNGKTQN